MIQEHLHRGRIANIFLEHGSLKRCQSKRGFASRKYYGISVLEKSIMNGF
jgi:hypothetical protein